MNSNKKNNIFEVLAEYDQEKRKEIAIQKAKEKKALKKQRQKQRRIQQQKENQNSKLQIKSEQKENSVPSNIEQNIPDLKEKNDSLTVQNELQGQKNDQKEENNNNNFTQSIEHDSNPKFFESTDLVSRIRYLEETIHNLMNYINQLLQSKSQTDFTIFNLSNDVIQLRNENTLLRGQIYEIAKFLLSKEQEVKTPLEKDTFQQKTGIGKGQQEFFKSLLKDIVDNNVKLNQ